LLDIGGRKVLELRPGPNDASRLNAGVYFVRSVSMAEGGKSSTVSYHKIVIQR